MKNTMKRVLSGVFCLMLLLSLCGTAFATEPTGTLTITGKAEAVGRTVKAYQLFSIVKETDDAGEITYTYTLNDTYAGFFSNKITGFDSMNEAQKSNAAYQYVLNRKTGDNADKNVQDFADAFITWIDEQATPITPEKTAEMQGVKAEGAAEADPFTSSTATITDVAYGYYLVFVGNAPASLVNVTDSTTPPIELKAEYPTVDKKVEGGEHTSAEIGQKVNYTLTSKVPDMDGYTSYVLNFKDTLSTGLTFNNDVKVTIDGTELTPGTDYVVTYTQATNSFVVEMKNMIDRKDKTGKDIVVTYSAAVNENAVVTDKANTNKATVEYSNDPASDSTGESTEEVVEVYTFDIDINKVAHGTNAPLAGATFELRASSDKNDPVIKLVQLADDTHFRVAKEGETGVDTVTTGADGTINIKGLKEGTYYLFETKAPDNYNPLTDPVKVEITAEYNADGTLSAWYVNKKEGSTSGNNDVEIENRAGAVLPGTGGIGTAIFAILGVGLVIGGTQMMGRKKKNEEI